MNRGPEIGANFCRHSGFNIPNSKANVEAFDNEVTLSFALLFQITTHSESGILGKTSTRLWIIASVFSFCDFNVPGFLFINFLLTDTVPSEVISTFRHIYFRIEGLCAGFIKGSLPNGRLL